MVKLKDVVENLKKGDTLWIKTKILGIGDQNVELDSRHFDLESTVISSLIGADCYGEAEVFIGDIDENNVVTKIQKEITPLQIVEDKKSLGMVEAYEKILLSKKITIE